MCQETDPVGGSATHLKNMIVKLDRIFLGFLGLYRKLFQTTI